MCAQLYLIAGHLTRAHRPLHTQMQGVQACLQATLLLRWHAAWLCRGACGGSGQWSPSTPHSKSASHAWCNAARSGVEQRHGGRSTAPMLLWLPCAPTSYTDLMWGAERAVDSAGTAATYSASGMLNCAQTRAHESAPNKRTRLCGVILGLMA